MKSLIRRVKELEEEVKRLRGGGGMEIDGKHYDQIVITRAGEDTEARIVTADSKEEVLAVISDDEVIEKDGYKVKLVPVEGSTELEREAPARQHTSKKKFKLPECKVVIPAIDWDALAKDYSPY